jgi:hypothetical protein
MNRRTDYNSLLGTMARYANGLPEYQSEKVAYYEWYINGNFVQAIFEYNQYHGDILRQWAINGVDHTDMKSKYPSFEKESLLMDCSNGLIGERAFEKKSIVYEYFIKPLKLNEKEFEYQEYTDKIGYRVTPHKLNRILYGENYSENSTWLGWNHPAMVLIAERMMNSN